MRKYIVKVEKGPDFDPEMDEMDQELIDGIQSDGFLLLSRNEGDTSTDMHIVRMTIMNMAVGFAGENDGGCVRQARAVADGLEKAKEIKRRGDPAGLSYFIKRALGND
jgi:hypothetical protein